MDSELDILISYYQAEKQRLEALVKDFVEEFDYEFAWLQSQGLQLVINQLRILGKLKDPNYDAKSLLENQRKYIEKTILRGDLPLVPLNFASMIARIQKEEDVLKQEAIKPVIPGQELDDAIFDLVERVHDSFRFYLRKSENIYLEFQIQFSGQLSISFPANYEFEENYYYDNDRANPLLGMGFVIDPVNSRLTYTYKYERLSTTLHLKEFLARILFDVFSFNIDNPTIIEFRDIL